MSKNLKRTSIYQEHQKAGAQLVDFSGWHMPLHYGSQIQEHHHVRQYAGIFDVSHMGVLDIQGEDATLFLRYLLANDVAKLKTPGRALYSCMLNENGGVIDDLIVYYLAENTYRIIVNAARCEVDLNWLQTHAENFALTLIWREDLCILAVQGPAAIDAVIEVLGEKWQPLKTLKAFNTLTQDHVQAARTGYTGEDGVELILPEATAIEFWQAALAVGVKPCGLGARDTLRLEAGLSLYGADLDEGTSPLIANLAWTVSFKDETRNFIGRAALLKERQDGVQQQLYGLVMQEKGVLRNQQAVYFDEQVVGTITSGSFSPTLGHAIAFARLPVTESKQAYIERRGQKIPVKIVQLPFVRFGEKVFEE